MKLLNIFKKSTKKVVTANATTLNKNQLSKVIGGGDGTTRAITKSGVNFTDPDNG